MKWTVFATLCALPLAIGGSVNADLVRRTEMKAPEMKGGEMKAGEKPANEKPGNNGNNGNNGNDNKESSGGTTIVIEETIIIWVNAGGASTTVTMGQTMTNAEAATKATHTVIVGGPGGLVYTPESINAAVGDMVIFTFMSQNHTVTQSTFGAPCVKLPGGMDSGFMANANNSIVPPPQMAMQVAVDTPIWFYCKQRTGSHCGKGMTFSINPTADKTQAMFKQMAIAQNGTGDAAPIVGGAAPPPPGPATVVPPPPAGTPPAEGGNPPPPPSTSNTGGAGVTPGQGNMENGSCSCSCMCGVASFPMAAVQGRDAWGGMAGSIPMASMMS